MLPPPAPQAAGELSKLTSGGTAMAAVTVSVLCLLPAAKIYKPLVVSSCIAGCCELSKVTSAGTMPAAVTVSALCWHRPDCPMQLLLALARQAADS